GLQEGDFLTQEVTFLKKFFLKNLESGSSIVDPDRSVDVCQTSSGDTPTLRDCGSWAMIHGLVSWWAIYLYWIGFDPSLDLVVVSLARMQEIQELPAKTS
ncbi:hypothetical protein FOL47_002119, partial [Perkinsus chesapeaki]